MVKLSPWERILIARHPKRPTFIDFLNELFDNFVELHGDRLFGDDPAIITGLGTFENESVVIIGQEKGKSIQEKMKRNFGMPHPEGYRKALRVMKLAEKFSLPVISFIDTAGAYPGIGAEERGQAWAIANNLKEMSLLETPIIVVVLSEGGSGGALGIGVGDYIMILENAYYSVISPEGCASILFRDSSKAPEAAEALKITSEELLKLGLVDEIISEPNGGAHEDFRGTVENLKKSLSKIIRKYKNKDVKTLLEERWIKLRNYGRFLEEEEK
ncbi:acetyl-CoA carboxylase carboxyltransferase subunit alpha [Dictyoglomus thermophilum]|uniref:Acetyl-coenzyme A carboxylase carboxyl transferase subunit alpha n=2 Tax=Dictyoglomus thermophilum TaxID=14 RepID=B5YEZ5_DICT6|nr:acetyl-CoA carboxylase carboxyltransferase subunit alpha [Dictyoglomus thermophilum]ACI18297.1 acetyl-CoA carboxylase, carboxyl transferase, alpha subunit [Dictyoglomus thermophilum H-6-12]TYT22577.1 acetyl-CoA carboxylase carboxyltransferase subunit alpha [Dictyoglomus thermophilum]